MIYMSTRLVVNVSQVYLPMYITETIQLDKVCINEHIWNCNFILFKLPF